MSCGSAASSYSRDNNAYKERYRGINQAACVSAFAFSVRDALATRRVGGTFFSGGKRKVSCRTFQRFSRFRAELTPKFCRNFLRLEGWTSSEESAGNRERLEKSAKGDRVKMSSDPLSSNRVAMTNERGRGGEEE